MLYPKMEKETGIPLVRRIYERIRDGILRGELAANEKLDSTRKAAELLNVSRNTVLTAYDMLIAEGYLTGVPGSGIYVASGAGYDREKQHLDEYTVTAYSSGEIPSGTIDFSGGTPALDLFPRNLWCRTAAAVFREAPVTAFGYDYPQGRPELRKTLASYLKKTRGIECGPDRLLITTGTKQGLTLIAACLASAESEVWIEDPSNVNVRTIFSHRGCRTVGIPADSWGMRTDLLPQGGRPSLVVVTPSHQFPLGGILPIQRRIELLDRVRDSGGFLVEDDYDSEFTYRGIPVCTLRELAPERVIYVGTFSKTLFPSLRLGYLVLPRDLVESFCERKRIGDHHTNSLNQLAVMRFIENGDLDRHIARMKKVYRKRRDVLISLLEENFPGAVTVTGENAGMYIVAEFSRIAFTPDVMNRLENAGLNIAPVELHAMKKGMHTGKLILGYAHLDEAVLEEGIGRLRKAIG